MGFELAYTPSSNCLPFCECVDRKKHYLPCKHIFAVIKKFEMSQDRFPTRYRDSPFFKTDFDLFDRDDDNKQNNSTQSAEAICNMEKENGCQNVIYSELI